jgi:GNAT superfamily N-acetyltransferase
MDIQIAQSDAQVAACFSVMHQLRPHLDEESFLARVRLQEKSDYRLAYLAVASEPVAVAGFRISENLAWGRFLYVDDLITLAARRSQGHGTALLDWLAHFAAEHDCAQLHLDSGVQRKDAHRFYQRENLNLTAFHFSKVLDRTH